MTGATPLAKLTRSRSAVWRLQRHGSVAELIHEFTTHVTDRQTVNYVAQAWGRRMEDGRWEGWLVFLPVTRGFARRTGRETTQANLEALAYWVTGLEPVYLEGALDRSYPLRLDSAA